MRKYDLGLPVLALVALAAFPAVSSAATRGRDTVADVPPIALRDLGPARSTAQVRIAMTLRYRNDEQLDSLIAMQTDKTSPLYLHFLSNEQFDASFAPAALDYNRVIAELQRAGFRVTSTYPNRTVIDAVAPVRTAERFFGTQLHNVLQPGVGVRVANATPARMPASLQGLVMNVDGLNTLTLNHADFMPPMRHHGGNPDLAGPPLYGPVNPMFNLAGFGPLAFSQGYDLPQQHAAPTGTYYVGTGRVSGIVIDADYLDSDLTGFLSFFKVSRSGPPTVRIPVDGGPPSGDGSPDSIETTLDVETIVGNAPGTRLYVYEFPNFSNNGYITDAYNKVVSDNLVDTANSSFGGCETSEGNAPKAWNNVAKQGAAKGITFHASSGDFGSNNGCVQAPASGPYFLAVGGTDLSVDANGNWTGETAFNGSGGGISAIFPTPTWQKTIANVIQGGRNVPDVAFDAAPSTGAAFYYGGTFDNTYDPIGGTSLSSPIFGAAQTEWDQVIGNRFGLAGQRLSLFFKKNGYGVGGGYFHDITSGSNGEFNAVPGYDQVTGIGSMDVWNIERNL